MIRMIMREDIWAPLIVCDVCADMIAEADEGVAVYGEVGKDNVKVDVLHAHKGRCHELADKRVGSSASWQELGLHLFWLCRNTEIDEKRFTEIAQITGYLPDA